VTRPAVETLPLRAPKHRAGRAPIHGKHPFDPELAKAHAYRGTSRGIRMSATADPVRIATSIEFAVSRYDRRSCGMPGIRADKDNTTVPRATTPGGVRASQVFDLGRFPANFDLAAVELGVAPGAVQDGREHAAAADMGEDNGGTLRGTEPLVTPAQQHH